MDIKAELIKNKDEKYKDFQKGLVPNVDESRIIGVRLPVIRKLAKQVNLDTDEFDFNCYEEAMMFGIAIGNLKYNWYKYLDVFVPIIDNWAVCDSASSSMKFVKTHQEEMWNYLKKYMYSENEYEVRFVVVIMMDYYINDEYIDRMINYLSSVKSDKYYINMAIAWALSFVYFKYKEKVMKFINENTLSDFVHNKTIQKIRESNRISKEEKISLNKLKR